MAKKIGPIRYNVNERGRQYRGTDRRFDLRALCSLVNGPEVQERVKNRDMVGYYGHWQRAKFGLVPPEWVLMGDKQFNLEPAIVTTRLQASEDGTIEHETEFLDTESGKIAARLHDSKTGGFSSAIQANPRGGFDVPTMFAGFDYVLEPNFTTNRGYAFDSAMSGDMVFDAVMEEMALSNRAMNVLYDSLRRDHELALQTMARLAAENEEMLSMLAAGSAGTPVFDGVQGAKPLILDTRGARSFRSMADSFRTAPLAAFERPEKEPTGDDATQAMIRSHYGVR